MDKKRFEQLKHLVDQAFDLAPADRRSFLASETGDDDELMAEVLQLLAYDTPTVNEETVTLAESHNLSGKSVGRYKIIEQIGAGGMGTVYLAAQSAPLRRRVALKVIKLGMDTKEVIARFESERQALALMDHPNIAQVFDAGATEQGRPYFVMEYIKGIPLVAYCREHNLGLRPRLELFIQVCRGVHHAHQKGVIHRDIKPGNILVTEIEGHPVPKIIDFGVAKATGQHLAAQTLFTQIGQMIGTLEYMSPEQAESTYQDVDTRSDIYSLGVILYELMTGILPIDRRELLQVGLGKMGNHIKDVVPPKPSTRLTNFIGLDQSKAETDITGPRTWAKRIKGDLDWITMKALEKERDCRYGSAEDLAEDILRHLSHHTVLAGPPSNAYRLRKFVRRNRTSVTVGALLLAALIVGATGTTIGMVRARKAEAIAVAATGRAEASLLFQLSRAEERPPHALPYAIAALERDDRMEYRLQIKRCLLESRPYWRLPVALDSHNPTAIGISPDGSWMAVGWAKRGSLQLYSFAGGKPRMLEGHHGALNWAKFSPDSQWLATVASDSMVMLWAPAEGIVKREWRFPGKVVPFFDQANNRLITYVMTKDNPLQWQSWPLDGGPPTLLGTTGPVLDGLREVAEPDLDPTRHWVVVPVEEHIDLYDLNNLTRGPVRTIGQHGKEVTGAVFSPDSTTIACFDDDGGVSLWDLSSPSTLPIRRLQGEQAPIHVCFDATGRRLAVSGHGGLKIWDLTKNRITMPTTLNSTHWMFGGAYHPLGDWFITIGTMKSVAAWPLTTEQPWQMNIDDERQGALGISPDGRHLIVAAEGIVRELPLDGNRIGEPQTLHVAKGFGYNKILFDDNSQYAFLSTCNSTYGLGTITRIPLNGGETKLFTGFTCSFVIDGEGRFIASSADQGLGKPYVQIFDTATDKRTVLDESTGDYFAAGGFTQDGRLLVMGSAGVGLWDTPNNNYIDLAPDIKYGWLTTDRRTVLLISQERDLLRKTVDSEERELLPLRFLPGGFAALQIDSTISCIAASIWDGPIHFLNMVANQDYIFPLFDTLGPKLALDPKQRWVVATSGGEDGILKLLAWPTGIPLEDMPRDALLARLAALTNLRVARDDEAKFGYTIAGQGVPDWQNPPR